MKRPGRQEPGAVLWEPYYFSGTMWHVRRGLSVEPSRVNVGRLVRISVLGLGHMLGWVLAVL